MPGGRMSARAVLRDSTLLLVGIMAGVLMSRSLVDIGGSDCGLMLSKRIEGPEIYYPHNSGELADGDVYTKTTLEAPTNRISTQQRKNAKAKRPKTLSEELKSSMRKPLFIGVVTAQKLLSTRAKAVNKTWGAFAPKLMFFSSQEREGTHGLPVVSLPGVDDTYPPQKKVYRMLKYMHDNYINDYNWFMRADDDVYVRVEKLINFLGQLDPNKELYIGQGGTGKPQDLERIKLRPNEHYCMGGPGVIFSRALLVRLAPYLEDCLLNEVVSWNEDLEVGRCISRRLGIQCTWNYEMSQLFYMDYSKGELFNSEAVYKDKKLPKVLTVHSFKDPDMMFRIHQYFLEVALNSSESKTAEVKRELAKVSKITGRKRAFA